MQSNAVLKKLCLLRSPAVCVRLDGLGLGGIFRPGLADLRVVASHPAPLAVQAGRLSPFHKAAPTALLHRTMQQTNTHKITLSRSSIRCRRSRPVYLGLTIYVLLPNDP